VSNPLRTSEDYELFLYTLNEQFPSVRRSTVTFIRRGASLARVTGELYFDYGIRLVVRERLVYHRLPVVIDWYGYEVWRDSEKLYWYDSQPHPNDPILGSTHPHHKHISPDMWKAPSFSGFTATTPSTKSEPVCMWAKARRTITAMPESGWSRRSKSPGLVAN